MMEVMTPVKEENWEPIAAAAEVLGDRWTLLILRDIVFHDRRHFRALLGGSAEGIATNILADRLARLLDAGILRRESAGRGRRAFYDLTDAGIDAIPILFALAEWGRAHRDADVGGPDRHAAQDVMRELRARRADGSATDGP